MTRYSRPIFVLFLTVCLLLSMHSGSAQMPKELDTKELVVLNQPFLFSYGTWDKKAQISGGVNLAAPLDLRGIAGNSPALQMQVGPRNTLKTLKLMLGDASEHRGTWVFTLPAAGSSMVVVQPASGTALSHPDSVEKGDALDLGKIVQWQILGDWGGSGPVDVQISRILAAIPDAAMLAERQVRADAETASEAKAKADRAADRLKYAVPTTQSPVVEAVYAAAPSILALVIHTGHLTPSHLSAYRPQPGDKAKPHDNGVSLLRGEQEIGYLIGPKQDGLVTFEGFSGDPLLTTEADDPANYQISSADDPAFAGGTGPVSVSRKTKPDDWQQPKQVNLTFRHVIYLSLPHPLTPGKTYTLTLSNINVQKRVVTLAFHPAAVQSESVHVSQIGFRPDDPQKRAFLSVWTNGVTHFPAHLKFHLEDAATGTIVFNGTAGEAWKADKPETMQTTRNFNGTDVSPLDFSAFRTPGRYKVFVEGVGCSYPFEISRNVWTKAFQVQMKGFYNQRSGVALGPPQTPFIRPADFRPGVPGTVSITQSTYGILDGGDPQKDLAKGDTRVPVSGAWGGYHDAGDWNPRRITHLRTTTFWQLQLLALFPDYFKSLPLGIPKTSPAPDLLNECRFALSLFRRLQSADGGVRFGIETNGDPRDGEVSWKQSMPAYVYAPDVQSSYIYAGIAARAARVLAAYDPAEAATYRVSALKAMAWAEADRAKRQSAGTWAKLPGDVTEDRNLAAVEVYTLTNDPRWQRVFLEDTELKFATPKPFYGSLMRRDAAFSYALLPAKLADPTLRQAAGRALLADADGALAYQRNNAWEIASDDPGKPQFLGFYSTPHGAVSLLRAYHLTHDRKYLAGAVGACLFCAGANPSNLVYTSGLGANPVKHVLNLDSRLTGQPVPVGLTPYGNVDLSRWGDQTWITWPITYFFGSLSKPSPAEWPTTEAYFDVFFMPAVNEFTMDQTMGPSAFVWGYLAARR